jgi:hypothetical protein
VLVVSIDRPLNILHFRRLKLFFKGSTPANKQQESF